MERRTRAGRRKYQARKKGAVQTVAVMVA